LRKRRGFTILEVLVVLLILGILAGIAGYNYKRYSLQAKRIEALENLGVLRKLEEVYRAEKGYYVTCDWSPKEVPPPQGTTDWNKESYFYLLGFKPQGILRYRYAVAKAEGNKTVSQCMADVKNCYDDSVVKNGFTQARDGIIDVIIKAEGDLDGDGVVGKLFVPDEPPERIVYVNYSVY